MDQQTAARGMIKARRSCLATSNTRDRIEVLVKTNLQSKEVKNRNSAQVEMNEMVPGSAGDRLLILRAN